MAQKQLTVALTGASGFVGRHVLRALIARGYAVRALVREAGQLKQAGPAVTPVPGDLFNAASLGELCRGADAVVHLVGIIMERPARGQTFERVHVQGTRNLLAAATQQGVRRWVHMSALGARWSAPRRISNYHRTKWLAEQAVRTPGSASGAGEGLAWTIFRPSIIHGPDGEFMQMVKGFWCHRLPPFVPYFGSGVLGTGGAGQLQPAWVEDVAHCFAAAVESKRAVGEVYPLGGPVAYTWPDLYATVKKHLPADQVRNKKIVAVPAWYAKIIAGLPGVPFNKDQVMMSQEDSTCEIAKAQRDFEITFAAFDDKLAEYSAKMA